MNAYFASQPAALASCAATALVVLLAGFAWSRLPWLGAARFAAWLTLASGVAAIEHFARDERAGFRMLALCGVLLYAMKGVVSVEARARGEARPSPLAWFAFALLWFGMRPAVFATRSPEPLESRGLVLRALRYLAFGITSIAVARFACAQGLDRRWATPILLVGLSLTFHFAAFDLLAALWRSRGFACQPLFREPWRARGLAEFWSRRWNLAFSEMTALALFRPLATRFGRPAAVYASFLASGILHELALSLPVHAGYGLPLAYFALHGALVLIEERGAWPIARTRTWTLFWLVVPVPLLFHAPFLRAVVWPLLGS